MACITTCTGCGACYESQSEEMANEPVRLCMTCRKRIGPDPYTVVEWESGFYVEKADDQTVDKSVTVRGPFKTKAAANRWAQRAWAEVASARFGRRLHG